MVAGVVRVVIGVFRWWWSPRDASWSTAFREYDAYVHGVVTQKFTSEIDGVRLQDGGGAAVWKD